MSLTEEWTEETKGKEVSVDAMDKLVQDYADARGIYDESKKVSNKKWEAVEAAESQLRKAMEISNKTRWDLDGVGRISFSSSLTVKVPKSLEDKRRFFTYLKTLGADVFDTYITINHNSLNSFYSQESERATKEGRTNLSIPGLEPPKEKVKISLTRSKK